MQIVAGTNLLLTMKVVDNAGTEMSISILTYEDLEGHKFVRTVTAASGSYTSPVALPDPGPEDRPLVGGPRVGGTKDPVPVEVGTHIGVSHCNNMRQYLSSLYCSVECEGESI
jgi:hypothetical protein